MIFKSKFLTHASLLFTCLVTPSGGECTRPPRVLAGEQCTHPQVRYVPLPTWNLDLHLIQTSLGQATICNRRNRNVRPMMTMIYTASGKKVPLFLALTLSIAGKFSQRLLLFRKAWIFYRSVALVKPIQEQVAYSNLGRTTDL